ncbi:MAG: hypothetical protein KAW16_05995 [candidate division Zixibacteria bacterium]|nr:hypothetical protein [candidate division Zixibacteria bacterium]
MVPFLLFLTRAEAIDLSATGGWTETVDETDLVSGAGSDLIDTYESATDATTMTIYNCTGDTDNWQIKVRRIDEGGWHQDFTLSVKRTSDGNGNGSVSGGLSYIEITTTDTELFSGAGNRSNISIQYKLTGMSINVSPDSYSKTIAFTVVDIP